MHKRIQKRKRKRQEGKNVQTDFLSNYREEDDIKN